MKKQVIEALANLVEIVAGEDGEIVIMARVSAKSMDEIAEAGENLADLEPEGDEIDVRI